MTPAELAEKLTAPWRHGVHADLRGRTVAGPVDLSGDTLCSFDVSSTRFQGDLVACAATFRGMSWMKTCTFGGVLRLPRSLFRHDLRLDGVRCGVLDLSGARLQGVLCLDGARIEKLDLRDAVLFANLSLAGARVGTLHAQGADLMGGVWSASADLPRHALAGAHVEGRVRTSDAQPGLAD